MESGLQRGFFRCILLVTLGVVLSHTSGCMLLRGASEVDDFGEKAEVADRGDPKIKPGIVLRIAVTASGEAALPDTLRDVDVTGSIQLPHIGVIKCEGLTIVELQYEIAEAYKKYYIDPQVTVSFAYTEGSGMKSPWGEVLVMGQVARPGPVNMPSTREMNVTRALMMAGNVTALAKKDEVRVTRRMEDGSLKKFIVNIEKIGREGRIDLDIMLMPGDVVWVPESWY